MKTSQIKAEVLNLKGEKVQISKNYNKMDISKLTHDVYVINYIDVNGKIIKSERFVKGRKLENVMETV
jgi:hypothetical protein